MIDWHAKLGFGGCGSFWLEVRGRGGCRLKIWGVDLDRECVIELLPYLFYIIQLKSSSIEGTYANTILYLISFAGKCAMLFAMNRRLSEVGWSGAELFIVKRNAPSVLTTHCVNRSKLRWRKEGIGYREYWLNSWISYCRYEKNELYEQIMMHSNLSTAWAARTNTICSIISRLAYRVLQWVTYRRTSWD